MECLCRVSEVVECLCSVSEALDMELHIFESLVVLTGSSVPPVCVTALVLYAMLDQWIAFTCAYLGISYFSLSFKSYFCWL